MLENGVHGRIVTNIERIPLPENGTLQSNMMYAGVGALAGLFSSKSIL